MKRVKKHQVKTEKPETSTSQAKEKGEHDLAYFIHDRVELLHQVFQCIKPKDLKAMAPHSVRHISLDDLQELCLEELLGISSKRLCAILDGADPPSDTDSSTQSSEHLETISLDSISSDEDILSQDSNKHKKHKHRRKQNKKKKQDRSGDGSHAPRAGLTVLELLELQARARAIRAQLRAQQAEQITSAPEAKETHPPSDNEVEIKEEPAEVVEISSDDEKHPGNETAASDKNATKTPLTAEKATNEDNTVVTKRISNLVITVPQNKTTRKIKLNRSKVSVTNSNDKTNGGTVSATERTVTVANEAGNSKADSAIGKGKDKGKKKRKGKKKVDKEGSDQDEITLQLSDSEKMDLLEDFDRKNYDSVTSSSSDDSSSSSSDDTSNDDIVDDNLKQEVESPIVCNDDDRQKFATDNEKDENEVRNKDTNENMEIVETNNGCDKNNDVVEGNSEVISRDVEMIDIDKEKQNKLVEQTEIVAEESKLGNNIDNVTIEDKSVVDTVNEPEMTSTETEKLSENAAICGDGEKDLTNDEIEEHRSNVNDKVSDVTDEDKNKNISEGELSENSSSEVEAFVVQPEVVCISDDEAKEKKQKKKKNKKEKKAKKEKKSKKPKPDFRESGDQNFYKEKQTNDNTLEESKEKDDKKSLVNTKLDENIIETVQDSDEGDIYEIFELIELSDDSSSCEVEGVSVLSKEPTAEEIEALSAKIDEIEREEVVTDEQIKQHETCINEEQNAENISWKDRYLDSKKVKKVLSTSNILNALRKKNKELKKKMENSRKIDEAVVENEIVEKAEETMVENLEGTIEQYNTLQGSTKYVNPVVEKPIEEINQPDSSISGEMKKDAKQLLKMYKKLLKYNDMTKQKDPEKRRKKKNKKNKAKESVASDK